MRVAPPAQGARTTVNGVTSARACVRSADSDEAAAERAGIKSAAAAPVDSETVLMKDTKARAIAAIVRKTDTPHALDGTAPVAGEGAFPGPHSTISTFG
jgi:hypothetical protein